MTNLKKKLKNNYEIYKDALYLSIAEKDAKKLLFAKRRVELLAKEWSEFEVARVKKRLVNLSKILRYGFLTKQGNIQNHFIEMKYLVFLNQI